MIKLFSERATYLFTFIIYYFLIIYYTFYYRSSSDLIFITGCLTMWLKYSKIDKLVNCFDTFGVDAFIYFSALSSFFDNDFIISRKFCRIQGSIGIKDNICIKKLILSLHMTTSVITVFWQQTQTIGNNPHLRHTFLKHFIQKDQKQIL